MSRYYYTDPLAVAWMSKWFGMRFEPPYNADNDFTILEVQSRCGQIIKFYVQDAILSLFGPQDGDVIQPSSSMQGFYIIGNNVMVDVNMNCMPHTGYMDLKTAKSIEETWGKNKIIQRNAIPFMWPEVENA